VGKNIDEQNSNPAPIALDQNALATAISAGVAEAIRQAQTGSAVATSEAVGAVLDRVQGRRQLSSAEYRTKTPWDPIGRKRHERPQLLRIYYQNGFLLDISFLSDTEIRLLDEIEAGKYLNDRVTVLESRTNDGSPNTVEINYPLASHEDHMMNARLFSSFEDLLSKIIAEHANPPAPVDPRSIRRRLSDVSDERSASALTAARTTKAE
jgi:hypothetical protein